MPASFGRQRQSNPSDKRFFEMNDSSASEPASTRLDKSIFTILGGTTIPERAAIVRAECHEGVRVELRRREGIDPGGSRIDVWLECKALLGLVKGWKKIGHVPDETAAALPPIGDESSTVVAYGTVKTVYAPLGRDEAVVTVEIGPQTPG
jgi:hypothetical protein